MLRGSARVNTPASRSSALLRWVTRWDHRRLGIRLSPEMGPCCLGTSPFRSPPSLAQHTRACPASPNRTPMPPQPAGQLPATFRRLLIVALLLPLAILVCRARSLWYDESALGANIVMRSYAQLFEPLSNGQVAPIGYLLLSKLSNTLLGHNDIAIRLPSIAAYLCLFAVLARRADRSPGRLLRFVLIVAAPGVVRYAFELKQYICDVLLMVVLLELGEVVFSRARWALVFSIVAVSLSNITFIQLPIFALLAGLSQV